MYRQSLYEPDEMWKWLLIDLCVLFLPLLLTEARFSLWGIQAEANVTQVVQSACRLGCRTRTLWIQYRFADQAGLERTETDCLPPGYPRPAVGNRIDIEYCAGLAGESRLMGNRKVAFIYFFLGAIFASMSLAGFALSKDAVSHHTNLVRSSVL